MTFILSEQSFNLDDIVPISTTTAKKLSSIDYEETSREYLDKFITWNPSEQLLFVKNVLKSMDSTQHGEINLCLSRMLQRDFIGQLASYGLEHISERILGYLDEESLKSAELVSREWYHIISQGMLWKKLIERKVMSKNIWYDLSTHRCWHKYLFRQSLADKEEKKSSEFYRYLYHEIVRDLNQLETNWLSGNYHLEKIPCHSKGNKGVYCLQYDDDKIVCGLRDNTIQIWNRKTLVCDKILKGHIGSVLCLQYDDKIIISGSSDSTIRIWDIETGNLLNTLLFHSEAVLHLRFVNRTLMTCSKDRSVAIWELNSPTDLVLHRTLLGHRAAVNVIDFDDKYIVSASGDRTIKVWKAGTFGFVRALLGHKRGIACLQYQDQLVISGSSDHTIRIWNIESGSCIRILEGHEELVRCVCFNSKFIVSGAYDGKIKIWDLQAALDPRSPSSPLCIKTLTEHNGRVFRLQFDEFQIVSSSHDDTILCFNFLQSDFPMLSKKRNLLDSNSVNNTLSISNVNETQMNKLIAKS